MPSKYVPPQLRSKDGPVKTESNSPANYPSQSSKISEAGSRGSQRNINFQNQNFNRANSFNSYQGPNTDRVANSQIRRNQSANYYQEPVVISYVEKQRSRGIDPFKPVEVTPKPQQGGRFASWDHRSQGGSTKSPLGFHGSIQEDPQEEARLFSSVSNTGINFDKYDAIPVEVSGTDAPGPLESFTCEDAKNNLPARLLKNLALCGFAKPTPVQKHSIPIALADRDMMACAQTGSGKTGGFLFPIVTLLMKNGALVLESSGRFAPRIAAPNALVLAPTRELVIQIYEEAEKFCYATGIRTVVVYGGASSRDQRNSLTSGCDILVGTPGRLIDFLDRGDITLKCIQQLVLDEADRMLDMGFEPSIRRIVHEVDMPRSEDRRTFMFSATFPREIQKLASDFMTDYIFLTVGRVGSAAKDITQSLQYVDERQKLKELINVLNSIQGGLVLVFVQTKRGAESVQVALYQQGFPTSSIHGDRTQQEREAALQSFKDGETPILVATDVAARGLDIDNVTFVINYDMPGNIDDYVHRIGRTGRAGNKGTALSFFNDKNASLAPKLLVLLQENNQEVPNWLQNFGRMGGRSGGGGYSSHHQSQTRDFRRSAQNPNVKSNFATTTTAKTNGPTPTTKRFNGGGGRGRASNGGNNGVSDAW